LEILYTNTWTKLLPNSQEDFERIQEIKKRLTYTTFQYNPITKKKEKVTKNLLRHKGNTYYFLSGLYPIALKESYPIKNFHTIIFKKDWENEAYLKILRDYQLESIRELMKIPRGILWASTGSGKTVIMIALCKIIKENIPILIIIPKSQALLEQTVKRFLEVFPENEIGFNYGKGFKEGRIMISSPACLEKLSLNYYNCIITDECQHAVAKTIYQALLKCKKAFIRYGFSGTPFGRSDQKDLITIGLFGLPVKKIKYNELVEKGYLAKLKYIFVTFESEFLLDQNITLLKYSNDWNEIANKFFLTDTRKYVIKIIVDYLIKAGRNCLIIVERKLHGQVLEKELEEFKVKFVSSDTYNVSKEIEKFKKGDYNVLIATSLIETGIDIPDLNSIILAGIGKSSIQLLQRVGRGLRPKDDKELLVFDLVDLSSVVLKNHALKRKRYVKKEGFPTIQINVIDFPVLENFLKELKWLN